MYAMLYTVNVKCKYADMSNVLNICNLTAGHTIYANARQMPDHQSLTSIHSHILGPLSGHVLDLPHITGEPSLLLLCDMLLMAIQVQQSALSASFT